MSDLVERLRWYVENPDADDEACVREAADEIEHLRARDFTRCSICGGTEDWRVDELARLRERMTALQLELGTVNTCLRVAEAEALERAALEIEKTYCACLEATGECACSTAAAAIRALKELK